LRDAWSVAETDEIRAPSQLGTICDPVAHATPLRVGPRGIFLDADGRAFCYANADLRKDEEAEDAFRFMEFWKKLRGALPRHLVFGSRLTTYATWRGSMIFGSRSSRCGAGRQPC